MAEAMLPQYEEDPTRFTKNAFSRNLVLRHESPNKVKDYAGNAVMGGVDFRTTSLHYNRGVTLNAQKARVSTRSNFLPVHMQN